MFINAFLDKIKTIDFFSEFFTEKGIKQFKKYLVTGFLSFGIEYSLFRIFNEIIFVWYHPWGHTQISHLVQPITGNPMSERAYALLLANTIAYVVIFWFNFFMNRMWSFESQEKLSRQLKQYGTLFAFNLLASSSLLYVLSEMIGIVAYISKIFVMGAIVSWNFIIYKKIIYKK